MRAASSSPPWHSSSAIVKTGRTRYWWLQLVVFTLGFGALKINVVYPAMAAAYALFVAPEPRRRKLLVSHGATVCPLGGLFLRWHRAVAPLPASGTLRRTFRPPYLPGPGLYAQVVGAAGRLGCVRPFRPRRATQHFGSRRRDRDTLVVLELRRGRTTVLFFLAWCLRGARPGPHPAGSLHRLLPDHSPPRPRHALRLRRHLRVRTTASGGGSCHSAHRRLSDGHDSRLPVSHPLVAGQDGTGPRSGPRCRSRAPHAPR